MELFFLGPHLTAQSINLPLEDSLTCSFKDFLIRLIGFQSPIILTRLQEFLEQAWPLLLSLAKKYLFF